MSAHNIYIKNIYIESFWTFFKIGAFTLGGGYAMIPIIEEEVVEKHRWISHEEMVDLIAVAQSCPGVFAINISTFVGYKLRKTRGAVCAALGTALPSFLIILLIARFFRQFQDNAVVARTARISWANCWIPLVSALAIWALGVSPILIIAVAAIGGLVFGKLIPPSES